MTSLVNSSQAEQISVNTIFPEALFRFFKLERLSQKSCDFWKIGVKGQMNN